MCIRKIILTSGLYLMSQNKNHDEFKVTMLVQSNFKVLFLLCAFRKNILVQHEIEFYNNIFL